MNEIKVAINIEEKEQVSKVDNESVLWCLHELNENILFKRLLEWGVIEMRAEHYKNADINKFVDDKICASIEDAIEFVKSSNDQTYIYIDGQECMNIFDLV